MSAFSGPQGKGAARERRRVKRAEAEARQERARTAAPLWCDEHMEPCCPRHSQQVTEQVTVTRRTRVRARKDES